MKAHKYWSIGALICMLMAMISGYDSRWKGTHHYWAMGACGCMLMSVYTGYKMVHRKPKKQTGENPENKESAAA